MEDKKIAILIDSDNIASKYIKYICDELAKYGTATYKRIYGNWTDSHADSWKKVLLEYAITPIQQYSYTTGKNATDSAMIIDAMDILYSGNVDGFCIVSSDSDFTRLAVRLREAGKLVIGMGEKKTPSAFITACEKFIYLEMLLPEKPKKTTKKVTKTAKTEKENADNTQKTETKKEVTSKKEIVNALKDIILDVSGDDGWASLADVVNLLSKRYPDFDSRLYGFKKPSTFIRSLTEFETEARAIKEGQTASAIFVRIK